ncbi:MAG TPA: amidohydrolase family protein [Nocardioides sp.]|uniref:amidohydrolase family protein n=1 Tax=uncultured Nocardioides sp. TaxID=198441 RepID=UPI00260BEA70|nr:amidohydrolase family protein [uncultured Nocardioides sp.]HRI94049.1 amidohydrolase family protein [Nocardioides sp.]HRK44043.1 amidohydrolase family protein [Nocardioides sp.]
MTQALSIEGPVERAHRDIPLPRERTAQVRGSAALPAGLTVVSADNHWTVTGDIFYERFPAHLRERAPRLRTDEQGNHLWELNGESMLPPAIMTNLASFETVPGATAIEPRLRDLDAEGVVKELNFGNAINLAHSLPDLEVRDWVYRIYNQHLAELAAQAPGRFYGVGMLNHWDMAKVKDSLAELIDLGLKTFMLPQMPKGADNSSLNYCLPEMDPLWAAIEESGLPVCFHVGEFFQDGPGGLGTTAMVTFGPFRKNLGELIFGGIFDRHPGLQVVFAEGDLNWVPGALQTAEMVYDCFAVDPVPARRPTEYWHDHCYATFQSDPIGLSMLDVIGADRVMWASDYPHAESTFGLGWTAMEAVVDAVTEEQARMILGDTATRLFKL